MSVGRGKDILIRDIHVCICRCVKMGIILFLSGPVPIDPQTKASLRPECYRLFRVATKSGNAGNIRVYYFQPENIRGHRDFPESQEKSGSFQVSYCFVSL